MTEKKYVRVDPALHAAWKAEADGEGRSLTEYVERAVEAVRAGVVTRPAVSPVRPIVSATVNPRDCTNRLPAGSWCSRCASIHQGKKG